MLRIKLNVHEHLVITVGNKVGRLKIMSGHPPLMPKSAYILFQGDEEMRISRVDERDLMGNGSEQSP